MYKIKVFKCSKDANEFLRAHPNIYIVKMSTSGVGAYSHYITILFVE